MKSKQTCLLLLLGILAVNVLGKTAKIEMTAGLSSGNVATTTTARLFDTQLPGNVIYWRAASFTPVTSWSDLTIRTSAKAVGATGLILDLRSNTSPADFAGAVQIARFLSSVRAGVITQQVAFTTEPVPTATLAGMPMVVVLTNRETRGAAEVLAASLQAQGALVMGEATTGKHAVVPDVTTTADSRAEAGALALIDRQQVDAVITETAARHRMSEAALVKGQDPDQDAFIASHEQVAPSQAEVKIKDVALVEALDSFKAIRVLQGEESSPQPRVADASSTAGLTVIASNGLR